MKKIHLLASIALCAVAVLAVAAQTGGEGSILRKDFTATFRVIRNLGAFAGFVFAVAGGGSAWYGIKGIHSDRKALRYLGCGTVSFILGLSLLGICC